MRILSVHNRYRSTFPSGEDRVVDQEAAALVESGHTVERFQYSSDDISGLSLGRKALIPVQVVWNDEARRKLRSLLQERRPDVVHVHNTFPRLSPSVLYACRAERVPVVTTLHNYSLVCASGNLFRGGTNCDECRGRNSLPGVIHGCYRNSSLATLPLATSLAVHREAWRSMVSAYVFLSRAQRDIVVGQGLPPERVFVKSNFVPRQAVAPQRQRDDIVVFVGRLSEEKGLPFLMRAWDRYCDEAGNHGLKLILAGAGPLEKRVAAWTRSRASAEWTGMLQRDECSSLVARARAVVVPSQWQEPFGLVVAEAMAAGVPPIAPAHGSFPEMIRDGVDGVLFPPGDVSALAKLLEDIACSPGRFLALGEAAHDTYEQRYSPETNVNLLLAIYQFAIEHPVH